MFFSLSFSPFHVAILFVMYVIRISNFFCPFSHSSKLTTHNKRQGKNKKVQMPFILSTATTTSKGEKNSNISNKDINSNIMIMLMI